MSRLSFIRDNPDQFAEVTNSDFLYQQAPCGFISFLPNGSILRVNQTFLKWLQLTEEEIYKIKFTSLLTKAGAMYYEMVIHPLLDLRGFANEISFSFVNGEHKLDTLFNAVVFKDEKGAVIAINATVQDITDRKKYEAQLLMSKRIAEEEKRRFEFLSNATPNLIWTALPNGQVNFINKRTEDYLNLTLDKVRNLEGLYTGDRHEFIQRWEKCLKSGRNLELELRMYLADGKLEWFFLRAEPYYNDKGVIELWFGSGTNIHKQKKREQAKYSLLKDSLNIAHQTIDGHKERFVQIAMNQSHFIRKPLANILGIINLLNDISFPEEGKQLLNLLNSSAEELDMIIKKIVSHTNTPD